MKTYNDLFDNITSVENILDAIEIAAKGKKHKYSVRKALEHKYEIAEMLSIKLRNGTWKPIDIHTTREINDGIEMKKRYIVCPAFVNEQVVHHAIMLWCEPLFRRKYYEYSCGSVKGKGLENLLKYLRRKIDKNPKDTKYVVKLDIKKFFYNIRPSLVFREIRKTIRDKQVLMLMAKILRANKQNINGKIVKQGVPIGFYTSPIFANVLLNHIDHYIKNDLRIKVYARYMDDIILFDSNKRKLKKNCKSIIKNIENLYLIIKPNWQVERFYSITFVGYQYKRNNIRLKDKIFLKTNRLAKRLSKKQEITIHDCLRMVSYVGRYHKADTFNAYVKYISPYVNVEEYRTRISTNMKRNNENGI